MDSGKSNQETEPQMHKTHTHTHRSIHLCWFLLLVLAADYKLQKPQRTQSVLKSLNLIRWLQQSYFRKQQTQPTVMLEFAFLISVLRSATFLFAHLAAKGQPDGISNEKLQGYSQHTQTLPFRTDHSVMESFFRIQTSLECLHFL